MALAFIGLMEATLDTAVIVAQNASQFLNMYAPAFDLKMRAFEWIK